MPYVTITTGFLTAEGENETLTLYLCDWPGCPNAAVNVLGSIKELRALVVVCEEHTPPHRRQTDV